MANNLEEKQAAETDLRKLLMRTVNVILILLYSLLQKAYDINVFVIICRGEREMIN